MIENELSIKIKVSCEGLVEAFRELSKALKAIANSLDYICETKYFTGLY